MNGIGARRIVAHLLYLLIVIELLLWNRKERMQLDMYFSKHLGFQRVQNFIFSLGFSTIQ